MTTYTLYNGAEPNTHTDDPKVAKAHALKVSGRRLMFPDVSTIPPLPRMTLPKLDELPLAKVYAALEASIEKANGGGKHPRAPYGKADENGYWLDASDAHRALMRAPDWLGDERLPERDRLPARVARIWTPGPVRFVLHEGFAEAWRRMTICAGEYSTTRDARWIELSVAPGCGGLLRTVDTGTQDLRDEYADVTTEGFDVQPPSIAISFRLNPGYLAPLLRHFPIEVACRPAHEPIVFSPEGADWRYILMPIRT